LGSGVDMIVVLELCHGQQVIPIILLLVHKEPEVLVQLLVDTLRLPIGLGVPGYRRYL